MTLKAMYTTPEFGITEDREYSVCGKYKRDGYTVFQIENDDGDVVDVPAHMLYE